MGYAPQSGKAISDTMIIAPHPTNGVAVVGGSAAGLFAAHLVARRGLPVQVFESADRLDPVPRTLIVTSQLYDLLGTQGTQAVVNEIRRFELFTDGRVATVPLHRPDLVVERSALTWMLAHQAQRSGAQIHFGKRFRGLEPAGSGLILRVERGRERAVETVQARVVIGADGAFSRVALAAGWPMQHTIPLVQVVVQLPKGMPHDTSRVWFIPEETPYFYWLIPDAPGRGVLGLIGEEGPTTRRCLERFLERRGLEPIEFQGARIPVYKRWVPVHRRVGGGHVYLVGDAGGQVKVTTIGGVMTGFRGALGVAEAIRNGGSSRHLRVLRRELDLHLLIRRILNQFTQRDYSRVVDLLNASARRALGLYTRDEAARLLWHLCLGQPRLLLLAARAIFSR